MTNFKVGDKVYQKGHVGNYATVHGPYEIYKVLCLGEDTYYIIFDFENVNYCKGDPKGEYKLSRENNLLNTKKQLTEYVMERFHSNVQYCTYKYLTDEENNNDN